MVSPERKFPADDGVDKRKHKPTVESETQHHHEDVPAELHELLLHIFHLEQLASNKEADSERCEVDDPACDPHHHDADTFKKLQQRLGVLPDDGDGDAHHDAEYDEAKLR